MIDMINTFLNQTLCLDIMDDEVGTVLLSEWILPDFEEQIKAADATIEEWLHAPIPDEFISLNALVCQDHPSILFYAQWKNDQAHKKFIHNHRPKLVKDIDKKVQNVIRPGLTRYRLIHAPEKDSKPSLISKKCHYTIVNLQFTTEMNFNNYIKKVPNAYFHLSLDKKSLMVFIPYSINSNKKYLHENFWKSEHLKGIKINQYKLYRSIHR